MKYDTLNQHTPNPSIHTIKAGDIIYGDDEADAIERCPHDKDNPYVMINVNVIRDASISSTCRWLLCYLLSNDKGWKINRRQVAAHIKEFCGRDKTDNMFNEAINAGYMKKVDILIRRKEGGALRRCKYYISETPKFKKSFQHPSFQGPEFQAPGNTCDKVISSESNIISKNPPLSSPPKKESLPRKKSLRSEEEEVSIFDFLEGTKLSPNDKLRLCKYYTREQVQRALKISETQKIKKTLMSLLINILDNPDK